MIEMTPYSVSTKSVQEDNTNAIDLVNCFVDPNIGIIRRSGFEEIQTFDGQIIDIITQVKDADGDYFNLFFYDNGDVKIRYNDGTIIPVTKTTNYFNALQTLSATNASGRIFVGNSAVKVEAQDNWDFDIPRIALLNITSGGFALDFEIKIRDVEKQLQTLAPSSPPEWQPLVNAMWTEAASTTQYYGYVGKGYLTADGGMKYQTMQGAAVDTPTEISSTQPPGIASSLASLFNSYTSVHGCAAVVNGQYVLFYPVTEQGKLNLLSIEMVGNKSYYDFIVSSANTIDDLPPRSMNNHFVQIGNNENTAYYMQFIADIIPQPGTYKISSGKWKESYRPKTKNGRLKDETMPHELVIDKILGTAELKVFEWGFRSAGDASTNAEPDFIDSYIYDLRVIQNRLCISANDAVSLSKTNDYLRFYRSTCITLNDDERVSYYIQGLNATLEYDRNIIISNDKTQYAISTKTPISPKTTAPSLVGEVPLKGAQLYSNGDTIIGINNAGNDIKHTEIAVSSVAESLVSLDIGQKVNGWLSGQVVSVDLNKEMTMQFIATSDTIYVCRYVNQQDKLYLYSKFNIAQKYLNQEIKKIWSVQDKLYVLLQYTNLTSEIKSSILELNLSITDYINNNLKYLDFHEIVNGPYTPVGDEVVSFYQGIPQIEDGALIQGEGLKGYKYQTKIKTYKPIVKENNSNIEYNGVIQRVEFVADFATQCKVGKTKISSMIDNVMLLDTITRSKGTRIQYLGMGSDSIEITSEDQTFILNKLLALVNIKRRK